LLEAASANGGKKKKKPMPKAQGRAARDAYGHVAEH
jgi:hypothetical protein